jgi:hypothetical protein
MNTNRKIEEKTQKQSQTNIIRNSMSHRKTTRQRTDLEAQPAITTIRTPNIVSKKGEKTAKETDPLK